MNTKKKAAWDNDRYNPMHRYHKLIEARNKKVSRGIRLVKMRDELKGKQKSLKARI